MTRLSAWIDRAGPILADIWRDVEPYAALLAAGWLIWTGLHAVGLWLDLALGLYAAVGITLARSSGVPAEDALAVVLVWPWLVVLTGGYYAYRYAADRGWLEDGAQWLQAAIAAVGALILWQRPRRERTRHWPGETAEDRS